MATQTWKQRHADAMLSPMGEDEQLLVHMFQSLTRLTDQHPDDSQSKSAIEDLGSAIIQMLNFDTGRLDQGMLGQQVRDTVERAGGDPDEL